MASARCYTKSGSVEKYESHSFSGAINHYPNGFNGKIIGPDSNGNYSITYEGYGDGTSDNYDCYCETIYGDWRNGGGVKKTFYFKEIDNTITIRVHHKVYGYSYSGCVAFDCSVSGERWGRPVDDGIVNNILKNSSIYIYWEPVTPAGPVGNYTTRITSVGSLILNTWTSYDSSKTYYLSSISVKPSSGTYNGTKWVINAGGGT